MFSQHSQTDYLRFQGYTIHLLFRGFLSNPYNTFEPVHMEAVKWEVVIKPLYFPDVIPFDYYLLMAGNFGFVKKQKNILDEKK